MLKQQLRRSSRLRSIAGAAAKAKCVTRRAKSAAPSARVLDAKALPAAASRALEMALYAKGRSAVAGVDEAGRGPLAGPVVAAACIVRQSFSGFADDTIRVRDSKMMSEREREAAFAAITAHPDISTGVHLVTCDRIDEINILAATMEAMRRSVEKLARAPDYVLIDGNRAPAPLAAAVETVVKGDSKVFAIACASVIAKVTRDRMMIEYDAQWPAYGFAQHKGYGTKAHMAAVFKHGASPIHRLTFAPLKTMSVAQLRVAPERVAARDRILAAKLVKKTKKAKSTAKLTVKSSGGGERAPAVAPAAKTASNPPRATPRATAKRRPRAKRKRA